jgi:SAM-dependent methyltransferase
VRRLQWRFVENQIQGKSFPVVVDVGTGAAPYKKLIPHERYIGIDREDRNGVSDVLVADINERFPLSDDIADLVLCTEVLEHTKDPKHVLRELYRILKPGGTIILTTPMTWPLHEIPNDYYRFTRFGLAHMFDEAGFLVIALEDSNGYLYTLLQLLAVRLRSPFYYPLVAIVNVIGYIVFLLERDRTFPMVEHVCATK